MEHGSTQAEALRVFASHGEDVAGLDPKALRAVYRRVVRRYRAELETGRGEALKAINPAYEVLTRTGTSQTSEGGRKASQPGEAEARRARYREVLARQEGERREHERREQKARQAARDAADHARQASERAFRQGQTLASVAAFFVVFGLLLAGLGDGMNDNNPVWFTIILAVSSVVTVTTHRLTETVHRSWAS